MPPEPDLPSAFFDRQDETDDAHFYSMPRFVVHIDAETIAALTQVYREILPPRCFPTKAIRAWHVLPVRQRLEVVRTYFSNAGGYDTPVVLDRSPAGADPLWIVMARRELAAADAAILRAGKF
jgi:hypothetical protein